MQGATEKSDLQPTGRSVIKWWLLALAIEGAGILLLPGWLLGAHVLGGGAQDRHLLIAMFVLSGIALIGCLVPALRAWRPGAYVTVGLAATFIGIVHTLSGLSLSAENQEMIDETFNRLLGDAGLAFRASALGVCLSIVATLVNRWVLESRHESQYLGAAEAFARTQEATVHHLTQIADQITATTATELARAIEAAGTQLSKSAIVAGAHLERRAAAASETFVVGVGRATAELNHVTVAMSRVQAEMDATTQALAGLAGDFNALMAPITALAQSQREAGQSIAGIAGVLKQAGEGAQATSAAIVAASAVLAPVREQFLDVAQRLQRVLTELAGNSEQLARSASSLAGMDNLESRLAGPLQNLIRHLDNDIAKVLGGFRTELSGSAGDIKRTETRLATESADKLERLEKQLTGLSESINGLSATLAERTQIDSRSGRQHTGREP